MALTSVVADRRKALGAYYTPPELVSALTHWAVRAPGDRILEPSAGEAAFVLAALRRLHELGGPRDEQVVAVELEPAAIAAARTVVTAEGETCEFIRSDFFDVQPEELGTFDAVIGNPPYVRYHRFKGAARKRGRSAAAIGGVELNGLASSWAHFVVHAARFLKPEGRLAFVLPAELLHVDYARPIREFLLRRFGAVTVLAFEEAVFPGASIDTVLLLAEGGTTQGLRLVNLRNQTDLPSAFNVPFMSVHDDRWSIFRTPGAGASVLARLRASGALSRLGRFASVDIGAVTGADGYFIVSRDDIKKHRLPRRAVVPIIARPAQLPGALLTASDARAISSSSRSLLLHLRKGGLDGEDSALGRYLRRGRRLGIQRGFKCRSRSPWYAVPGVRVPDAFMSYMSNRAPRLTLNEAGFTSTNLVHQLTFHLTERAATRAVIAALHSSIALLSFEMEGRSYGGGVLKHETREAERVELPFDASFADDLAALLPAVDSALREGGPGAAAAVVDELLVRREVLSAVELAAVRSSYEALCERRALRARTGNSIKTQRVREA